MLFPLVVLWNMLVSNLKILRTHWEVKKELGENPEIQNKKEEKSFR
jgi:hypothetical protein